MTRNKKLIIATIAALTLVAAVLAFVRLRSRAGEHAESHAESREHGEEGEASARSVRLSQEAIEAAHLEVVRVARGRLSRDIVLVGELAVPPDRMAMVGPRTAARISRVNVNVGDRVERGATLATVDSSEFGRARGAFITAAARVEQAQATYQRQELLRQDRISSASDFEAARANLAAARADLESARSALVALGLGAPGAGDSAGSAVTLRSPIAGVVVARQAIVGQNVDAAASLFTVADLSELWVLLTAYERDLGRVAVGQEVSVTLGALPGRELRGRVTHVGELLDERTRSARVRVVVPNEDRTLRPGMFCRARLLGNDATQPAEDERPALTVPAAALQRVAGEEVVFVRGPDRTFAVRRVRVGARTATTAEIQSGLREGEEVVADGSLTLKSELERSSFADEDD
ncbi:MAG: efflux RND transporter periplasmic adaptor subunit [Kofleriaceae bacterium]|jgi:cobalt-zinc-cadmium efflux system membrane fusion protein|nr:efflux RND transporter periplasmic adaptor subunit [Kofleriaceae bacterium]